jgi:hypothetical protein
MSPTTNTSRAAPFFSYQAAFMILDLLLVACDAGVNSRRAIILTQMVSVPQIGTQDTFRRIQRVQTVTIAWMSVEAAVSLFAAWRARSPALLAFGGDSAIELFSETRKGGLPESREPCCSHWLPSLPSPRSRACWGIANPNQPFWG